MTLDSRAWGSLFILEKNIKIPLIVLVVIGDQYWKDWLGTFVSQAAGRKEGRLRSTVKRFLCSLGLSAREGAADPGDVCTRQFLNFNLLSQSGFCVRMWESQDLGPQQGVTRLQACSDCTWPRLQNGGRVHGLWVSSGV